MRARNIKPAYFDNEQIADLSMAARLLFISLWCQADRMGRLEDRPRRIKVKAFPFDVVDIEALLGEIAAVTEDGKPAFIERYSVGGKGLIQIVNFLKHQKPHGKEQASTIPGKGMPDLGTGLPEKGNDRPALDPGSGILDPERGILNTSEQGDTSPGACESKKGDAIPKKDPLTKYPKLAEFYPVLLDYIGGKRPKPGSVAEEKARITLRQLVEVDGKEEQEIIDCLGKLFTGEDDPTANGSFDGWRSFVETIPALRVRKIAGGKTRYQKIFERGERDNGKPEDLSSAKVFNPAENWEEIGNE